MKKSIILILAFPIALILSTANVQAQRNPDGRMINVDRPFLVDDKIDRNKIEKRVRIMRLRNEYGISNLSEEQKTKIDGIRLSEQKQLLQFRNQLGEKRAKLKSLEAVEKADMKGINKVIDEIAELQGDIMKVRAEGKQKIRALLNEEQRIEFDTKGGRSLNRNFMQWGFRHNNIPYNGKIRNDINIVEE